MLNSKEDATDEEIRRALEQANAIKFINRLKEGIDTNAGASGGQLSGGEKQRIALARAFLRNPDVLILDEATSALDRKNESEVQNAIEGLKQQRSITTIVIAHRLSTIRNADKIIVIDKGEIKEQGSHESLLRDYPKGVYAGLVNTQTENDDDKTDDDSDNTVSKVVFSINDTEEETVNKLSEPINKMKKSMSKRIDKFSPSSNTSLISPNSFGMTPNDYQFDGMSGFDFSKSNIKLNQRKKSKLESSKEILAR